MNPTTFKRTLLAAVLMAAAAAPSQAGLLDKFKELSTNISTAVVNHNNTMWGDGGLGDTATKAVVGAVKGEKKAAAAFDEVMAAQTKVMATAHTDVKAVIKTLVDIVMWLPRKLQELFKKAMDKVRAFIAKLGAMNQGATVKERFNNLAGVGGGGGGESLSAGGADDFGGDLGDVSAFEDELGDIAASVDAPSAPRASASLPNLDGAFGEMLATAVKGLEGDKRKQAVIRVRKTYLTAVKLSFERNSEAAAKILFKEAASVFRGNPKGMQKAVTNIANGSGTKLAKGFAKGTARMSKSMQLHSR